MTDQKMLLMMGEVDEVLTRHGARLNDLMAVADRLLVSAFANAKANNPRADIDTLADRTLAAIRRHIAHCDNGEERTEIMN